MLRASVSLARACPRLLPGRSLTTVYTSPLSLSQIPSVYRLYLMLGCSKRPRCTGALSGYSVEVSCWHLQPFQGRGVSIVT